MIDKYLDEFIDKISNNDIELYNEAGLQHELGYFLRCNNVQVKFEYNTNKIFKYNHDFLKKELDLYVQEEGEQYCIELKFPNKGAYPRRMTQSIIDIFFLQQLIESGFKKCYFLFITELPRFTSGNESEGIYAYFRYSKPINELKCEDIPEFMIEKEAKKLSSLLNSNSISFNRVHKIEFKNINSYYYFLLKIN